MCSILPYQKIIGNGSFGVVFQAKLVQSGETVAIKKVLQDKRFKNRELDIMRLVSHPNVVQLSYFFYGKGEKVRTASSLGELKRRKKNVPK